MSINVASMVRNEMGRFWPRALETWATFADEIIVLDDGSTDGTREYAEDFGARVFAQGGDGAWGNESESRAHLFDLAWNMARVDDYIFILDADMVPARDPKLFADTGAEGIFFRLYDLWKREDDRLWYRTDDLWRGHLLPRVWMVKKKPLPKERFAWNNRGVHCGHLPRSLMFDSYAYAPHDYSILHYAYVEPELREEKYVAYAKVSSELTDFEREHARSILDPDPNLVELDFEPELRF